MRFLKNTVLVTAIAAGVLGIISGYSIASMRMHSQLASALEAVRPIRLAASKLSLVNPLVAYETPESTALYEYQELKSRIQRIIANHHDKHEIVRASVYYRNLETGAWIGINKMAYFYPASLLKVPVMIAYFKKAESNPAILEKYIRYKPITSGDTFEAKSSLTPGAYYRISELIERMIIHSDNGATYTLIDHIDNETLNEVYSDLGIGHPDDDSSTYQISTKTYALFFRALYNTTYLSQSYSQKALELLARANYHDGLVAGIPESITVAHKFGEHVTSSNRKVAEGVELHDCGIIYHPKQRFLLCVMSEAKTTEDASALIKAIAKEVYDTVDADAENN